MSFDAWIVGFGLSALLKDLRLVESNLAYLVLVGVALLHAVLLYQFFSVQLPQAKHMEALAAQASLNAELGARRTEVGFPAGHYAQLTVTTASGSGSEALGTGVRCQAAASQDYYGYYGASSVSCLFENDGATWTQLGSNGNAFAATNVIRLTVSGTTLTPNINGSTTGTPGAQTDATFANGVPGAVGYNNDASVMRMDSFECSDVVSAALAPRATIVRHAVHRAASW
jgi:hypothetical protein